MVLEEELAIDGVVLVCGDGDDGEVRITALEVKQAGKLFYAGSAPCGPEVEDNDLAAELAKIDCLDAI